MAKLPPSLSRDSYISIWFKPEFSNLNHMELQGFGRTYVHGVVQQLVQCRTRAATAEASLSAPLQTIGDVGDPAVLFLLPQRRLLLWLPWHYGGCGDYPFPIHFPHVCHWLCDARGEEVRSQASLTNFESTVCGSLGPRYGEALCKHFYLWVEGPIGYPFPQWSNVPLVEVYQGRSFHQLLLSCAKF